MKCFIVLGPARSGATLIAGVLGKLGIEMGNRDEFNVDKDFRQIHDKLMKGQITFCLPEDAKLLGEYQTLIHARESPGVAWGMRDIGTVFLFHVFEKYCQSEVCLIVARRQLYASIESLRHQSEITLQQALEFIGSQIYAIEEILDVWKGPLLEVDYNSVITDPRPGIERIASFCNVRSTQEAIDLVKPDLRHI